jgi:hypothetical protein
LLLGSVDRGVNISALTGQPVGSDMTSLCVQTVCLRSVASSRRVRAAQDAHAEVRGVRAAFHPGLELLSVFV